MERPTDGVSLVALIDASLTVDAPITIARGCDGNKNNVIFCLNLNPEPLGTL
jgi:hypothetical protein